MFERKNKNLWFPDSRLPLSKMCQITIFLKQIKIHLHNFSYFVITFSPIFNVFSFLRYHLTTLYSLNKSWSCVFLDWLGREINNYSLFTFNETWYLLQNLLPLHTWLIPNIPQIWLLYLWKQTLFIPTPQITSYYYP